tara:strand:- start:1798 stop:3261 length:1464 start_codon:yes stop_codon:yes gene_type:complete
MKTYLETFLKDKKYRFALMAFILGAATSFAMAPYYIVPLIFLGLSGLYILLDLSSTRLTAALTGYCFGLGYFGFGLSWIANALLVEGNAYAWAWPLAVAGLPALLSFFPAFGALCIKRFCDLKKVTGFFGFVFFLSISEWLRGNILTGFPWNLFAYTWGENLEVIQIISLADVYLLNILTIFWCATLGYLISTSQSKTIKITLTALCLLSFVGNYYFGTQRLNKNPTQYNEHIKLVLVQPNIKQSEKWQKEKIVQHYENNLALIHEALKKENGKDDVYIFLPETAFPPFVTQDPQAKAMLAEVLTTYEGNVTLIAGVLRYNPDKDQYFNSIVAFDKNAGIVNIYDKHHLVPFGEYIPFNEIVNIAPIVGFNGFQSGIGPEIKETETGFSYIPVICYEAIFSKAFSSLRHKDKKLIVNVTNDGWYGKSAGPYQHLVQTKFRAIENNVPLLRVANTGVSGLFDNLGRTVKQTNLFERTTVSNAIPVTNK